MCSHLKERLECWTGQTSGRKMGGHGPVRPPLASLGCPHAAASGCSASACFPLPVIAAMRSFTAAALLLGFVVAAAAGASAQASLPAPAAVQACPDVWARRAGETEAFAAACCRPLGGACFKARPPAAPLLRRPLAPRCPSQASSLKRQEVRAVTWRQLDG